MKNNKPFVDLWIYRDGLRLITRCFIFFFALMFVVSCGTGNEADGSEITIDKDYLDFYSFSLKPFDLHASIMLPDETTDIGASVKPEVVHEEGDFIWQLSVGPNFWIGIEDWGDYKGIIEEKRKELKGNEHYEVRFIIDTKDMLFYERKLLVKGEKDAPKSVGIAHTSYHICAERIIDGITYELRSRPDGYKASQKNVATIVAKSIQSFKFIP